MDLAFWAFVTLQGIALAWFIGLAISYERNRRRLRDLEDWVYKEKKPANSDN